MLQGFLKTAFAALIVASAAACGGGSSYGGTTTSTPTTPSPSTSTALTIAIVGSSGAAAFQPNPMTASVGQAVAWTNHDSTSHHIVLDNGSADLGVVGPGGTTATFAITTASPQSFHCTLHPSMVGTINGSTSDTNPGIYTAGR